MTDNKNDSLKLIEVDEALKPHVQYIATGINDDLRKQLITKSKEDHVLANTPADASERFGDDAMLDKWLEKGRIVHWLIGPGGDLAGIIWYGKSTPPNDLPIDKGIDITFAIRIYNGYFGKGLAKPFMRQSLKILEDFEESKGRKLLGLWLKTTIANEAAVAVYTKFGYQEIHRDTTTTYMVLPADKLTTIINSQT